MSRRNQPPACRGCRHLDLNGSCIYILNTGVSRPCPPGEDCIVKDVGSKDKRRIVLPPKREEARRVIGHARRCRVGDELSASSLACGLYAQGASDGTIAKVMGCCPATVAKWRRASGRPPNFIRRKRKED